MKQNWRGRIRGRGKLTILSFGAPKSRICMILQSRCGTRDKDLCEVIPEKVGFRRFEMKGNIMMLNGKRIVFKGVNRHEFSSINGRCVSEEELRKDLEVMKRNNT